VTKNHYKTSLIFQIKRELTKLLDVLVVLSKAERLKILSTEKRSSLFPININDNVRNFYNLDDRSPFSSSLSSALTWLVFLINNLFFYL
jgi:hypothetical protein